MPLDPESWDQTPRAAPLFIRLRMNRYGVLPPRKRTTSDPPRRGWRAPKFRRFIPSTTIMRPEKSIALRPVAFWPSMMPPEMLTFACPDEETTMPELELMVPFRTTEVLEESTRPEPVNVPFRRSTMAVLGCELRAELYCDCTLDRLVPLTVRSKRPMPLTRGAA